MSHRGLVSFRKFFLPPLGLRRLVEGSPALIQHGKCFTDPVAILLEKRSIQEHFSLFPTEHRREVPVSAGMTLVSVVQIYGSAKVVLVGVTGPQSDMEAVAYFLHRQTIDHVLSQVGVCPSAQFSRMPRTVPMFVVGANDFLQIFLSDPG